MNSSPRYQRIRRQSAGSCDCLASDFRSWPRAPRRRGALNSDPDEGLARGVAVEHPDQRRGGVLEAVDDRLAVDQAALGEIARELALRLREAMQVGAGPEAPQREVVR